MVSEEDRDWNVTMVVRVSNARTKEDVFAVIENLIPDGLEFQVLKIEPREDGR